jgi:hypothetical protein
MLVKNKKETAVQAASFLQKLKVGMSCADLVESLSAKRCIDISVIVISLGYGKGFGAGHPLKVISFCISEVILGIELNFTGT